MDVLIDTDAGMGTLGADPEDAFAITMRVEIETVGVALAGTSAAWLPGRSSEWSRPDAPDNALVATAVDLDGFAALFAERVLAQF